MDRTTYFIAGEIGGLLSLVLSYNPWDNGIVCGIINGIRCPVFGLWPVEFLLWGQRNPMHNLYKGGFVFKNAGIIAITTFLSRILGFIRDILIGAYLGTSDLAQAFFMAFKLPNLLRDIVAEGAASSAFIPILAQYKAQMEEEYKRLVGSLYGTMLVVLFLISSAGIIFAPLLVAVIAPGFIPNAGLFHTTVGLARFLFPYVFFIGLFAVNMSVLHTEGKFTSTAFGQPVFNMAMISSLLLFSGRFSPLAGLVIGVWAGALLQVGLQMISLSKLGYRPSMITLKKHPGIKKMFSLFAPRLFGTIIYHLNILVDTVLASISAIVGSGGIAAIYYSNRLMQFPLALFSTSIAQAVLPHLSRRHAQGHESRHLGEDLKKALITSAMFIFPSGVFLAMLSKLVVSVIFKRGAFDDYAVAITSSVLLFYAIGLIAFAGIKLFVSAFYSMQDTKTPVKTAFISLIANIVLNIALMFPLKIAGLALASAIAGSVNMLLLGIKLNKKIGFWDRMFVKDMLKIVMASAVMGGIIYFSGVRESAPSFSVLLKAMGLSLGGYLLGCGLFKCPLSLMVRGILRR